MQLKNFIKQTSKKNLLGLGTGIGNNNDIEKYEKKLFKNYLEICEKFNVSLIDTSPIYGKGRSEKLIGKYLGKKRDKFIIATKIMPEMCSKKKVKVSVLKSLKRLNIKYIDLLQIHWPNEKIPFGETIEEMIKLKKEGLIRNIGLCNFSYKQLKSICNEFSPNIISSIQIEYNLFERSAEKDLIPFCKKNNILIIAHSPLAQGKLVNGFKQLKIIKKLAKIYNSSPAQIILSWISSKKNIVAIPNSSSIKNLIDNFFSSKIKLKKEHIKLIDLKCKTEISQINTKKIKVTNKYGRKVYSSLNEALKNKLNMTPSPLQLSKEIKKGNFLKPIRVKKFKINNKIHYHLIEGRLRYWSWVIAFGWKKSIPALIWKN